MEVSIEITNSSDIGSYTRAEDSASRVLRIVQKHGFIVSKIEIYDLEIVIYLAGDSDSFAPFSSEFKKQMELCQKQEGRTIKVYSSDKLELL
jgi:hypothetical protein